MTFKSENSALALDIIIPTLNAAASLGTTLLSLPRISGRIIVCDGGSHDETCAIARKWGCEIVEGARGRGGQLAAGARTASAPFLLFLHADTQLSPAAIDQTGQFIANSAQGKSAAYFRFQLDEQGPAAHRLEQAVAWRCKTFCLPYGDQGLLISRPFYESLGGYKDMPLMEDVDLIWRLTRLHGKKALVALEAPVVTSAIKFRREGYFFRSTRNLFCLFLFWLKIPVRLIVKLY